MEKPKKPKDIKTQLYNQNYRLIECIDLLEVLTLSMSTDAGNACILGALSMAMERLNSVFDAIDEICLQINRLEEENAQRNNERLALAFPNFEMLNEKGKEKVRLYIEDLTGVQALRISEQ